MRTTWNFYTAGQLLFGKHASRQLGPRLAERKIRSACVVTDRNLVDVGIVEPMLRSLSASGIDVTLFDGGQAEPAIEVAHAAVKLAKVSHHDAVIGIGGGSNLDVSKFVAATLSHGGNPEDYFGIEKVPGPVMPLVCVPTTSGTGSEVSHAAVLTDTRNQIKISAMSNHLRPQLAIVDPVLTYRCPRQIMADSGIDALTHAVEAITATDFDKLEIPDGELSSYEGRYPLGECLAEKGIELVGQHLAKAVNQPFNTDARDGMSLAATLAGMAFSNCGVALVHALEYPIGGAVHCSHGLGNGLLLPYVMEFNLPERIDTLAHIAKLLGVDTSQMSPIEAAQSSIRAVKELKEQIGIPARLREIGVTRDQLSQFAAKTFEIKRLHWINPRAPSCQDLVDILEAAY